MQVEPQVGELVQAVTLTQDAFAGLQGVCVRACVRACVWLMYVVRVLYVYLSIVRLSLCCTYTSVHKSVCVVYLFTVLFTVPLLPCLCRHSSRNV